MPVCIQYEHSATEHECSGSMCICHTNSPGLSPITGEAGEDFFVTLQCWRLCICCGLHAHVNGRAVSLHDFEWDMYKRTTEDNKLPGSDHPQCPYRPISGTAMLHYPWSTDQNNKQNNYNALSMSCQEGMQVPAIS